LEDAGQTLFIGKIQAEKHAHFLSFPYNEDIF